jgi:hypothetical protein
VHNFLGAKTSRSRRPFAITAVKTNHLGPPTRPFAITAVKTNSEDECPDWTYGGDDSIAAR